MIEDPGHEQSPWRFLAPLDGHSDSDIDLVSLTRRDELAAVESMVSAERCSLLYAYSGNGKTSLIEAGIVPRFVRRDWCVFSTRPRPPWEIDDPTLAFKKCVVRGLSGPLHPEDQLAFFDWLLDYVKTQKPDPVLEHMIEQRRHALHEAAKRPAEVETLVDGMRQRYDLSIPKFVAELRERTGDGKRMLFICDQFEELFVHFADTPQLERFVNELGELWADASLQSHLLFSLREDWVGSMVTFRRTIPEIFRSYFKLEPLRQNVAREVLTRPLQGTEYCFDENAAERLIADLADAYSANQAQPYSEVRLNRSEGVDRFVELPALQVVADSLWRTREQVGAPFTGAHYECLPALLHDADASESGAGAPPSSPAVRVLDRYLLDRLEQVPPIEPLDAQASLELRLDCLYLLTDGTRHRRALSLTRLVAELERLRPSGIGLPEVTTGDVVLALAPLVSQRLVRVPHGAGGEKQYELAHDFAVRSITKRWRELDRRRAAEVAVSLERQERLAGREQREKRFLRWAPFVGIATLLGAQGWPPLWLASLSIFSAVLAMGVLSRGSFVGAVGAFGLFASVRSMALHQRVFDGYAFGLPLLGWPLPDLLERVGGLSPSVFSGEWFDWTYELSYLIGRVEPYLFCAVLGAAWIARGAWPGASSDRLVARRLVAELADVLLTVSVWWGGLFLVEATRPDDLEGAMLLFGSLFLVAAVNGVRLVRRRATLGMALLGLRAAGEEPLDGKRIVLRQLVFLVWSLLVAGSLLLLWLLVSVPVAARGRRFPYDVAGGIHLEPATPPGDRAEPASRRRRVEQERAAPAEAPESSAAEAPRP